MPQLPSAVTHKSTHSERPAFPSNRWLPPRARPTVLQLLLAQPAGAARGAFHPQRCVARPHELEEREAQLQTAKTLRAKKLQRDAGGGGRAGAAMR